MVFYCKNFDEPRVIVDNRDQGTYQPPVIPPEDRRALELRLQEMMKDISQWWGKANREEGTLNIDRYLVFSSLKNQGDVETEVLREHWFLRRTALGMDFELMSNRYENGFTTVTDLERKMERH